MCLVLMIRLRRKRLATEMREGCPNNMESSLLWESTPPIMLPNEEMREALNARINSRPPSSERGLSQPSVDMETKADDDSQRGRSTRLSKPSPAWLM
jgi:hypothetical protein